MQKTEINHQLSMEISQNSKRSVTTKVDLTAMVDLAFLLITFFMLASAFAEPKVMEVLQPIDGGDSILTPESKTATIIVGTRNKVYTYTLPDEISSLNDIQFDSLDYSSSGLRHFIQQRQIEVESQWGSKEKLFVIIKPLPGASFKNMIDVLDEMLINDVKLYTITPPVSMTDSLIVKMANEKW